MCNKGKEVSDGSRRSMMVSGRIQVVDVEAKLAKVKEVNHRRGRGSTPVKAHRRVAGDGKDGSGRVESSP